MKIKNLKKIYKYNKDFKYKFHMPGNHGGSNLSPELINNMPLFEVTEIEGMDDYHAPEGIIKQAEEELSTLYASHRSIFLVNGSTSGIIASMSYLFNENDEVLISRDSHKSVQYGLIISGAKPYYLVNQYDKINGVFLPPNHEDIIKQVNERPNLKGVVITTPNYYGIGTEQLGKISSFCRDRGIKLLLDEAHGSHLYFSKYKRYMGNYNKVDIVVNSFHKNLTGLTQTAMLHINNIDISANDLRKHVSLVTTTSPSYLLLASMEYCMEQYGKYGKRIISNTEKKVEYMKDLLDKYKIKYIEAHNLRGYFLDPTKITIILKDNFMAKKVYNNLLKLKIYPEILVDNKIVFFIKENHKTKDLIMSTKLINLIIRRNSTSNIAEQKTINFRDLTYNLSPRAAFYSPKETIALSDAVGRTATDIITTYPPGIPLVMPGEIISSEVINYIKNTHSSVHGVKSGMIEVVK